MIDFMIGLPERSEATPYYFTYIDRITNGDIVSVLERQLEETDALLGGVSEEKSLHRYAPEKWSVRQMWSHVNDSERVFVFRALWFARGLDTPLPSFEQDIAVNAAHADTIPWAQHTAEFKQIRLATLAFVRNLPADAWQRRGTASGNLFTVRALAFIVAGHTVHHATLLRDRYL
jgi:hypothetical protein